MLDPGRDIDQQREARGVAFGKAVFAEALDLLEAALGEIALVAARDHALDHLVAELADGADIAEGRHGAAQPLASSGVKPAATMASFIACSWNSGTPRVLPAPAAVRRRGCSGEGAG
jgi:hypothetical protein